MVKHKTLYLMKLAFKSNENLDSKVSNIHIEIGKHLNLI